MSEVIDICDLRGSDLSAFWWGWMDTGGPWSPEYDRVDPRFQLLYEAGRSHHANMRLAGIDRKWRGDHQTYMRTIVPAMKRAAFRVGEPLPLG